jgi:hypothetical protein
MKKRRKRLPGKNLQHKKPSPPGGGGRKMRPAKPSSGPDILLSGEVENARCRVMIGGKAVWLTTALLNALCILVVAQRENRPMAKISRSTANRLRKEIDSFLGAGQGFALIHTAGKESYRLATPGDNIRIDKTFPMLSSAEISQAAKQAVLATFS